MFQDINDFLIRLAIAAAVVAGGMFVSRLAKGIIVRLSKSVADQGALSFIGSCASIVIKVVFIVMGLAVMGLDMSVIVGALSAVSLGISLALRDTMNDVAGGIQILFTKPFIVGDYVRIEDKEGTVMRIEIFFTVLRTPDRQEVIVPNSTVVSELIVNYSKEKYRRIHIVFDADIAADVQQCLQLGKEVLDSESRLAPELKNEVVVDALEADRMKIGIYAYVLMEDYWDCLYRMNETLQRKRSRLDLVPTSRVSFKSETTV